MLRLTPPAMRRFSQANSFDVVYGGGESNVAVSLANYGVPVDFVTRLPKIYFLEIGAVSRGSKVVYDRAHSAMSTIEKGMVDWDEVLKGAGWFHWTGITPAISQGAADACLEAIQAAKLLSFIVKEMTTMRHTSFALFKSSRL